MTPIPNVEDVEEEEGMDAMMEKETGGITLHIPRNYEQMAEPLPQ